MLKLFQDAAAIDPVNADWQLGLAKIHAINRDFVAARNAGKRATELSPQSAEIWCAYGTAIFSGIQSASTLDQMGLADDGKAAYIQSLKLDPDQVEPRIGLAMFYINAPGIAGGSLKKAREQGNALLKIPGAARQGYIVLAMTEAEDDEWKNAAEFFSLARKESTVKEQQETLRLYASLLLKKKEDPKAVIALLQPEVQALKSEDTVLRFMLGEAHKALKEWDKAENEYLLVIAANPQSPNSRFSLAEVLRKQKKYQLAADQFNEFASRFPQDARAKKALEEAADCRSRQ